MKFGQTGPHLRKRRFGRAAIGSTWRGWSLWLDDDELEELRRVLEERKRVPLVKEILEAIDEARP